MFTRNNKHITEILNKFIIFSTGEIEETVVEEVLLMTCVLYIVQRVTV